MGKVSSALNRSVKITPETATTIRFRVIVGPISVIVNQLVWGRHRADVKTLTWLINKEDGIENNLARNTYTRDLRPKPNLFQESKGLAGVEIT